MQTHVYILMGILLFSVGYGSDIPCEELLRDKCECTTNLGKTIIQRCSHLTEVPDLSNMLEAKEKTVERLDLSSNKITTIRSGDFLPLDGNRYTLDISDNLIDIIEDQAFDYFSGSIQIKLDGNKLKTVPANAFRGVRNGMLGTLSLSRNLIESVTSSQLNSLPADKASLRINLSQNPLGTLLYSHGDMDQLHDNLVHLNLSYTAISKIEQGFVSRCVTTLDLTSTHLTTLAAAPFALMGHSCHGWIMVNVSNNQLESIDEGTFRSSERINELVMANCTLRNLPENILTFKSLTNLDLGDNFLSDFTLPNLIHPGRTGFNLSKVLLPRNHIRSLPNDLCERFTKLSIIDVYGNPITDDLSVLLKSCVSGESKLLSVYWPTRLMNCSCDQLAGWYSYSHHQQFTAFNCAYTHQGSCEGEKVHCSPHSDQVFGGRAINDLNKVEVLRLCGSSMANKILPNFSAVLAVIVLLLNCL